MKNKLTEVVLLTKSYNLQDFKDWLHWHLDIIGFDCCHIFDNESSVDIKSVCDTYGDKVTYELIKGWPNQCELYNRYINNESKSWWVFPIDDDEFLYVSDKYNNKINEFILKSKIINEMKVKKLAIGWRNLFPKTYTLNRKKSLIENANGWSNEASMVWQFGNKPVKTLLKTTLNYIFNKNCQHNPMTKERINTYNLSLTHITSNSQPYSTKDDDDLILYHYQFKSKVEWYYKCKNRKSPCSDWNKDFPNKYDELYSDTSTIKEDNRMINLWNKF